jgi:sialidase-1
MQNVIVYKDPQAYSCFPDVTVRKNGEALVVFRHAGGFSVEVLKSGRYDHVDKGSRIGLCRSNDGGLTWQPPEIFAPVDAECGEQDPSIAALNDGTLLINYFRWRVVPAGEKGRLGYPTRQQKTGEWADPEGPFVVRSFDGGKTWEKKPHAAFPAPFRCAGVSDSVLELRDGTLLMPIYVWTDGETTDACRAHVIRSRDGGATWGEPSLIAADPTRKISFEEPALAIMPDGRLLAMLRAPVERQASYLYRAFSADGGRTWTDLERTSMWGHPAHVLTLSDGRLLCTYGYRREPFGVRACVSTDCGQTWDMEHEYVLRTDGVNVDVGYPSSAQLADGTVLTVYYINTGDNVRHIACTRWHP